MSEQTVALRQLYCPVDPQQTHMRPSPASNEGLTTVKLPGVRALLHSLPWGFSDAPPGGRQGVEESTDSQG